MSELALLQAKQVSTIYTSNISRCNLGTMNTPSQLMTSNRNKR